MLGGTFGVSVWVVVTIQTQCWGSNGTTTAFTTAGERVLGVVVTVVVVVIVEVVVVVVIVEIVVVYIVVVVVYALI